MGLLWRYLLRRHLLRRGKIWRIFPKTAKLSPPYYSQPYFWNPIFFERKFLAFSDKINAKNFTVFINLIIKKLPKKQDSDAKCYIKHVLRVQNAHFLIKIGTLRHVYGPHHLLFRWILVQEQPARTVGKIRQVCLLNMYKTTLAKTGFGPICRLERDRNISFYSLSVLHHANVPTQGFWGILKNGKIYIFIHFWAITACQTHKMIIFAEMWCVTVSQNYPKQLSHKISANSGTHKWGNGPKMTILAGYLSPF